MNKEQQDKSWNALDEDNKKHYKEQYAESKSMAESKTHELLEELFGTHNLNPKPKIKTWEDVEKEGYKIFDDYRGEDISNCDYLELGNYCDCICLQGYNYDLERENPDNKIILKAIATLKIAKLIDLGYGGMVSEEEWKDEDIEKFCIVRMVSKIENCRLIVGYEFIAFHTPEQREEFMSYESNRRLVEQYYMM